MRISDWSPDVCSSDLSDIVGRLQVSPTDWVDVLYRFRADKDDLSLRRSEVGLRVSTPLLRVTAEYLHLDSAAATSELFNRREQIRVAASTKLSRHWSVKSEEHTSELQSLMRTSYAVFCLKQNHLPTTHQLTLILHGTVVSSVETQT